MRKPSPLLFALVIALLLAACRSDVTPTVDPTPTGDPGSDLG